MISDKKELSELSIIKTFTNILFGTFAIDFSNLLLVTCNSSLLKMLFSASDAQRHHVVESFAFTDKQILDAKK